MYFPNMSNLHLLLVSSMKTSKLIQLLPLKPTIPDISDVCEEEEEGGDHMYEHKEVGMCHSPSCSSSSSSSSSSSPSFAKDVIVLSKINREDNIAKQALIHISVEGNDGEGDDGYHTPTSPGRKIQIVCPSAPKKPPPPRRQTRKRKADHELINIRDVELLFCAGRKRRICMTDDQ